MLPLYEDQPHDEMCDAMEACRPDIGRGQTQKKTIYLAPRYTYKTTIEKCFMAFMILWYQEYGIDISIDYVRASSALAEDVLYELKNDLESCPQIVELWGNLGERARVWSQKKINLGGRRDNTISTAGLDFGGAGKHPDLVILDDMVNEKNYDSIKAKRAARVKVQSYFPILPPWGSMIVSGTRFAHNDVYGWILQQNKDDRRKFEELVAARNYDEAEKVRPQWIEYIRRVRDREGNLFFPTKLTEAFLEQQKRSVEARFYAAWYENDPDIEGMVRFKPEYLRFFNAQLVSEPIPMLTILQDAQSGHAYPIASFPVRVTMTIDPTLSANQTSDRVGMTIVATDSNGHWWVLHSHGYLEVPSRCGEIALELIRTYRPTICRIESEMSDPEMVARIQRGILAEGIPTAIGSYSALQNESAGSPGRPSRRKKNARIEAMEPRFRNGEISLHRGKCTALYDQYTNWPDVDFDDVFDSLAMHYSIAKACTYVTIDDYHRDSMEMDDEEPGWSGQFQQTLYDRAGNPVLVTASYRDRGEEGRLVGRAGFSAQRLNAR
jgi:hypothetical protein